MCQSQAEVNWEVVWWDIDYLALGFKPKYKAVSSKNSAKGLSKHNVTKSVVKAYELDNWSSVRIAHDPPLILKELLY